MIGAYVLAVISILTSFISRMSVGDLLFMVRPDFLVVVFLNIASIMSLYTKAGKRYKNYIMGAQGVSITLTPLVLYMDHP